MATGQSEQSPAVAGEVESITMETEDARMLQNCVSMENPAQSPLGQAAMGLQLWQFRCAHCTGRYSPGTHLIRAATIYRMSLCHDIK